MKIKGGAYFLMLIAAMLLAMMGMSLTMDFKAKLIPLVLGGVTLILVARELIGELRNREAVGPSREAMGNAPPLRGYVAAGIWIAGFLLGIYLFGFTIAIAAFVIAYMKLHGTGWVQSGIYAVLTAAVMYGIFQYFMKVELYPGIIFTLLDLGW